MGDEEWEEEDMKEFTKLVENSKRTWKPASKELEVMNLGTKQEKRELKVVTLVTIGERNRLVSLLYEYANVFSWTYTDMPGLDFDMVVHRIPLV